MRCRSGAERERRSRALNWMRIKVLEDGEAPQESKQENVSYVEQKDSFVSDPEGGTVYRYGTVRYGTVRGTHGTYGTVRMVLYGTHSGRAAGGRA